MPMGMGNVWAFLTRPCDFPRSSGRPPLRVYPSVCIVCALCMNEKLKLFECPLFRVSALTYISSSVTYHARSCTYYYCAQASRSARVSSNPIFSAVAPHSSVRHLV